eukprot:CAMPEP_0172301710 /NCGR_PEP_ID=MMETSP1058-20130122/3544_1 /TAXON_ID=83371 /ORGANISM="Detonula confervacea, Strain CCMP 353" /LENGTH=60 /DNA_ID=CAMNT_0013011927 /DNA_START=108 /DNA_END=288 /DNA_ORIENTATION=-
MEVTDVWVMDLGSWVPSLGVGISKMLAIEAVDALWEVVLVMGWVVASSNSARLVGLKKDV